MSALELTDEETATTLAALRFWQDNIGPDEHEALHGHGHFTEHEPLSFHEVDELCENLNVKRICVDNRRKMHNLSLAIIQMESAEAAIIEAGYEGVAMMAGALIKSARNEIKRLDPEGRETG